jgi:flagellar FliJ protein
MSELRSIGLAIEIATRRRDQLALALAKSIRDLQFARDQMAQLESYCSDTDARWLGADALPRSAELLRHHYQFSGRLQQAIVLQQGVIGGLQQHLDGAQRCLLESEFRLCGLNQVLAARKSALALKDKRRQQHHTDEFAALQHSRGSVLSRQGGEP